MDELSRRLAERGAPRVIIQVAESNGVAQRAFGRMGFRRTMIEMAGEVAGRPPARVARRRTAGRPKPAPRATLAKVVTTPGAP